MQRIYATSVGLTAKIRVIFSLANMKYVKLPYLMVYANLRMLFLRVPSFYSV